MIEQQVNERVIHWQTFGQTLINPWALIATLAMGVLLIALPRRRAVLPFLLVACFLPVAQRIVILGLNFNMMRILLLFAGARIAWRGEHKGLRLGPIDRCFLAWLGVVSVAYVLQQRNFGAVVYRSGVAFDALGAYFFMRCILRSRQEIEQLISQLAIVTIPLALVMTYEHVTGRNLFGVFGGVPAMTIVRDGKFRCQGAFSHPILAGTFGAVGLPLFGGSLLRSRFRSPLYLAACVAALLVVVLSMSSGPLMAVVFAAIAWAFWPLRFQMTWVRRGIVVALVALQMVMKNPVYHLIGRVSDVLGGDGYHRVRVIQNTIEHFRQWALIGSTSVAGWGWGLQDLTNQYAAQAVDGGLLALILFITLIVRCYRWLGLSVRSLERRGDLSRRERTGWQYLVWGMGASLTGHCASFISVAYFGQMEIIWFMFLGWIASMWPVFVMYPKRQAARSGKAPVSSRAPRTPGPTAPAGVPSPTAARLR